MFVDTEDKKQEWHYRTTEVKTNSTAIFVTLQPQSPDEEYEVAMTWEGFPNSTHYDWKALMATQPKVSQHFHHSLMLSMSLPLLLALMSSRMSWSTEHSHLRFLKTSHPGQATTLLVFW